MLTKNILAFCFIISLLVALSVSIDSYFKLNGILIIAIYLLLIFFLSNKKSPFNQSLNISYKQIFLPILLIVCLYVLNDIFVRVFIIEHRYFDTNQIIRDNLSLLFIIKAIIVFPFIEEFLFRKIFLDHLLIKYNYRFAILISAIGFTIAHLTSVNALHYTFIGGLFFGYIYYKFKNVFLCIFLHALNNALNIILPSISLILFENNLKMIIIILFIILLATIILAIKKIRNF